MGHERIVISNVAIDYTLIASLSPQLLSYLEADAPKLFDRSSVSTAMKERISDPYIGTLNGEELGVWFELDGAVEEYAGRVHKYLNEQTRSLLDNIPAHSALHSSDWRPRIGSIIFYAKDERGRYEREATKVSVFVKFGPEDLEFTFGKSAEETALKIISALKVQ